jgi:hypothetical protein
MASAAFRAIIVAHERPFVRPFMIATGAPVMIAVPGHWSFPEVGESAFGPQTIISTRDEIEVAAISQKLQLLANFWTHVSIAGINTTKSTFERIDVVDLKVTSSNLFHAFHYFYEPPAGFLLLIAEEQCLLPFREYRFLWFWLASPYNENFS